MMKQDLFITNHNTYCYHVISFGLKNTRSTYQCLVNKIFMPQIRRNIKVYIDDMLVKYSIPTNHISDIQGLFTTLKRCHMKLNHTKCVFGVTWEKFFEYMIISIRIKDNLKKITAVLNMQKRTTSKEVQSPNGKLAALSRFLSKQTEQFLLFFMILRNNAA